MTERPKFKTIDPKAEAARQVETARALDGERFTLLTTTNRLNQKSTPKEFEFKEGRFTFRLLPQPEDAENGFTAILPYVYVNPNECANMQGYLPLTMEQAGFLRTCAKALYNHPTYKELMADQTKTGISLSVKFKNLYAGFLYNAPQPEITIMSLPSNGPIDNKKRPPRIQAGTAISQFVYELDAIGNAKYDGLFSIESGRLITIDIHGAGDRREYVPQVDVSFPLVDAKYDPVLFNIPRFEDIINYQENSTIQRVLRKKVTQEMWDYLVQKLGFTPEASALSTPCAPVPTAPPAIQSVTTTPTNTVTPTAMTPEAIKESLRARGIHV